VDYEPDELVPEPSSGRVFERRLRPGIADVLGDGRVGRARLDAIARWLQDIAYLDLLDAGLDSRGAWVVRRCRIRVETFPSFGEELELRTFCSGIGRFCAERRTIVRGPSALIETVALWIFLEIETWRPLRLPPDVVAAYSEAAGGRGAGVRLRHPEPPEGAERADWEFRVSDLDLAGHINNSHYWSPLEAHMAAAGPAPQSIDAEIEHRAPAQPGPALLLRDGSSIWVAAPDGELHASILRAGPGR
jgi:acyl-ACP thioesterase